MATIDALRDLIWQRDRGVCGICRESVDRAVMSLDHIQPRAHGGPDTVANLRTAHRVCNSRRGPGRDFVREWAHVALRWPSDLRDYFKAQAAANGHSLNSEINRRLLDHVRAEERRQRSKRDPRNLPVRLQEWRTTREMTQQELADKIGVTRVALARIESGVAQPRPKTTRALAKALNVRVEDLMEPLDSD